jgi:TolA-binding protein
MIWLLLTSLSYSSSPLADLVKMGDCRTITAEIRPDGPGERLALGSCHNRAEAWSEAKTSLEPLPTGPLADYAHWQLARAELGLGNTERAIELLEGRKLPGSAGLALRLDRARALLALDRSLDARDDLRALLTGDVGPEARFLLAQGGMDRGEADAAIKTWERTWTLTGPWADLAAERLAEHGHPVPDPSTERGRGLMTDRINTLKSKNQHQEALALTKALHAIKPVQGTELADLLFDAREYSEAARVYAKKMGPPDSASGNPKHLIRYGLSILRGGGSYDNTIRIYERLLATHPDAPEAELASYKLGYLEVDRGNCPDAIERFTQHIRDYPRTSRRDEVTWWIARCAYQDGDIDTAQNLWKRLTQDHGSSSLAPGAAYWMARVEKDEAARETGLRAVLKRWPDSGYAWFAAHQLGITFPKREPAPPPTWPPDLIANEQVMRGEALLEAGFARWARDEFHPILGAASQHGMVGQLAAANALARAGDYRTARKMAARHCAQPMAETLCVIRPEHAIVDTVGSAYGIDPNIAYGVMLAESALDPSVTSVAGARGLMQLMPAEAPRLHETLYGDQGWHPDRLYDAPYNASLGTAELGIKNVSTHGMLAGTSLPATIASYNGGLDAVKRWRANYDDKPEFDEWVEAIGYTETRRYVKRVLGFSMAYRRTYGD